MTTNQLNYGLGRAEGESFDAYKLRRSIANQAVKRINFRSKKQNGLVSARNQLRSNQSGGGVYGRHLAAAFAYARIKDGVLPAKHQEYLLTKEDQKKARSDFNTMYEHMKVA